MADRCFAATTLSSPTTPKSVKYVGKIVVCYRVDVEWDSSCTVVSMDSVQPVLGFLRANRVMTELETASGQQHELQSIDRQT